MIPSSHALVSLKPARQLQYRLSAMLRSARERGARLPAMPYVRTFLRLLTGSGRPQRHGGHKNTWSALGAK